MRDSSLTLSKMLLSQAPVGAVLYRDQEMQGDLVDLVAVLSPGEFVEIPVRDVEKAAAPEYRDTLLLIRPRIDEERALIEQLEGLRETLVLRTRPLVLILFNGKAPGTGLNTLQDCASLASWLRPHVIDPHALDVVDAQELQARRDAFQQRTGKTPEEWMANDDRSQAGEVNQLTQEALFLRKK